MIPVGISFPIARARHTSAPVAMIHFILSKRPYGFACLKKATRSPPQRVQNTASGLACRMALMYEV